MLQETQTRNMKRCYFWMIHFRINSLVIFQKLTFQSCFNHCMKKFSTTRLTNMDFVHQKIEMVHLWNNSVAEFHHEDVIPKSTLANDIGVVNVELKVHQWVEFLLISYNNIWNICVLPTVSFNLSSNKAVSVILPCKHLTSIFGFDHYLLISHMKQNNL